MNKKLLNIFYWGIFAILLTVAGIVLLSSLNNNFPLKFLTVSSGSMSPKIGMGSIVIVNKSENYKVNDVVTFTNTDNKGQLITHRITGVEYSEHSSETYITKGDANEDRDGEKLAKENVIGKVVFSIPYLGFLVNFTKKPIGLVSLVIIPGMLFVASEINAIKSEIENIKKSRRKHIKAINN